MASLVLCRFLRPRQRNLRPLAFIDSPNGSSHNCPGRTIVVLGVFAPRFQPGIPLPESTCSLIRRGLVVAAVGLPLCIAAFAVVMAGALLADGLQEDWARRTLQGVGVAILLVAGLDALVLLALLGLKAAADETQYETRRSPSDEVTTVDESPDEPGSDRP